MSQPEGTQLIEAERGRQVQEEGYDESHDDEHRNGEIARAAAWYAAPSRWRAKLSRRWWPWAAYYKRPTPNDRIRELVKAGALIAAEIDRLQRLRTAERDGNTGETK